jgi:hypothetical protein
MSPSSSITRQRTGNGFLRGMAVGLLCCDGRKRRQASDVG